MIFRLFAGVTASIIITSLAVVLVASRRLDEGIDLREWSDDFLMGGILPHQ